MENNIPTMAKKLWSIVRVIYLMVRKGICKRKLLLDLNLMMKRGKIAGKALGNLMFHGSHHHHKDHADYGHYPGAGLISSHGKEYEFSCSNTPFHAHFTKAIFHLKKRRKRNNYKNYNKNSGTTNAHHIEDVDDLEGVSRVLEMMLSINGGNLNDSIGCNSSSSGSFMSFEPSPSPHYNLSGLGFGKSPMVRQLSRTDSPFPVQNMDDDTHVDEAADAFIQRFYNQLKRQKSIGGASTT